ncbi:MAG: RICIN domain-containing protein, partial [Oscillospiraceae bacterium]|nr:RICIN domain-containing protein [Oscillospiraceae bacterium]
MAQNDFISSYDDMGGDFTGLLVHQHESVGKRILRINRDSGAAIFMPEAWIPEEVLHFYRHEDGSYKIKSEVDGRVLDLDSWMSANGTKVHFWDDHDSGNQRWHVKRLNGWDYYGIGEALNLGPKCAGNSAFDVGDGNTCLWDYHGGWQQQFGIYRVSMQEHCGDHVGEAERIINIQNMQRDGAGSMLKNFWNKKSDYRSLEKLNVYYLFHSGFAVETETAWLIFDYFLDIPADILEEDGQIILRRWDVPKTLANGCVMPELFGNKQVYVF